MPQPTPIPTRRKHTCAAALFACATTALAQDAPPPVPAELPRPAQTQPDIDPDAAPENEAPAKPTYTREERFAQLADPDHAVRLAATEALLQDNAINEDVLAGMFAAAEHPEQRRRLVHIAEHHMMRVWLVAIADDLRGDGPPDRASVGFSYDPVLPDNNPHSRAAAVVVLDTMPGFPGHAYLRPGDVILSIDGRASHVATTESIRRWLGSAIGRHAEGDTLSMSIFRDGETLELTIPCAGIRTLNEVYTTTGQGQTARTANHQQYIEQALARLTQPLPAPEPLVPAQ